MRNMTLENNRIQLRAVEPEDLEYLFQWENDTELWHLSNTLTPFSRFTLKKYIESAASDIFESKQLRLMIERKVDGIAIGAIDLFDFDPFHLRAGIGILIAEKAQRRKGFASEALDLIIDYGFETLGLKQLYCNITENNSESLKLFISKGFIITGQKQAWIKSGENWLTEYFLQLLHE
jgi:diamine N-acetyltransferase